MKPDFNSSYNKIQYTINSIMRRTPFVIGTYYHIYNRGVNKETIFFQPKHWDFFIRLLKEYFLANSCEVVAYCLMPNHYHLLVYCGITLFGEKIMQPLLVSYTKSINKQLQRVGPIFQGPYQSKLITKNSYLLQISKYIHLNPVMAGLVKSPEDWIYSSYKEYLGQRQGKLPNPKIVLDQFASWQEYADFVCSGWDPRSGPPGNLLMDR